MKSHTEQIAISASAEDVFSYVVDPMNLPLWAAGFAKSVRSDEGEWFVETLQGEIGLRVESDDGTGVVDYVMVMGPGMEVTGSTRVVPHGEAAVYVFTQVQVPGMPDEAFDGQVSSLREELLVLKSQLEAGRPGLDRRESLHG